MGIPLGPIDESGPAVRLALPLVDVAGRPLALLRGTLAGHVVGCFGLALAVLSAVHIRNELAARGVDVSEEVPGKLRRALVVGLAGAFIGGFFAAAMFT